MSSALIEKILVRNWKDSDFNDAVVLNRESESYIGMTSENGDWEKDMEGIAEKFLGGGGNFLLGFFNEKLVVMGGYKLLSKTKAEVKRMRDTGIEIVTASTMNVQVGALRLYEGSGYKEIGRRVQSSGPEKDMILVSFTKKLN